MKVKELRDQIADFVADWVNETLPGNVVRGLDGSAFAFPFAEAELLAMSAYDPIFHLNSNYGWGRRWYALHRWTGRFIFTVGHGYDHKRREIPAEWVPEVLFRYFSRNEVTPAGKAWLK
jgi:hypothetical protein